MTRDGERSAGLRRHVGTVGLFTMASRVLGLVREWLMAGGFQGKEGQQVPPMTPEVVSGITDRYIELYEHITGDRFDKEDYSAETIEAHVRAALAAL